MDAEITATRIPPSSLATAGTAAEPEPSSDWPSVSEREPRETFQFATDMPAHPANANHPALQPQGEALRLTVFCIDLAHAVSGILSRTVSLCCHPHRPPDDDSSEEASSMSDDPLDTDPASGKGQAPGPGDGNDAVKR